MPQWAVEFTDDFDTWWNSLDETDQTAVDGHVRALEALGPALGAPRSTQIKGSRYGQMRELRVQSKGRPLRVLYAFDPRRVAILLIGGDKTGDNRWYEVFVPIADTLFARHLETIELERLLEQDEEK